MKSKLNAWIRASADADEFKRKNKKQEAWQMIMDIAEESGFIRFAYAGVALLDINEEEEEEVI